MQPTIQYIIQIESLPTELSQNLNGIVSNYLANEIMYCSMY